MVHLYQITLNIFSSRKDRRELGKFSRRNVIDIYFLYNSDK